LLQSLSGRVETLEADHNQHKVQAHYLRRNGGGGLK
jgi:hypothetical protein